MKKGFTLIELIVVIAIIAILVLLGSGLYKGYTKEANLTKHITYVKELESASERYYMQNDDWPRLSDKPYTAEQITTYAENIKDLTGEDVILEDGNYYEIDYVALGKYTKIPTDRYNYILQNPVGRVYYLEDLTDVGEARTSEVTPVEIFVEYNSEVTSKVKDTFTKRENKFIDNDINVTTDYTYGVKHDGTATLLSYNGTSLEVNLPGKINGFKITEIDQIDAYTGKFTKKIDYLKIPKGITKISTKALVRSTQNSGWTMKNIYVDPDNTVYKDIEGVMYSKDGKTLVFRPAGQSTVSYEIPEGVEVVESFAVYYNGLSKITLPQSLKLIKEQSFAHNNITVLTLNPNIAKIETYAFWGNRISKLYIPNNVKEIASMAFNANSFRGVGDVTADHKLGELAVVGTTFGYLTSGSSIGNNSTQGFPPIYLRK